MKLTRALVPAVLACTFVTLSAHAQTPASAPVAASAAAAHHDRRADFVESRIAKLHADLKITDQQSQQWDAYAQVMRENAQSTDAAIRQRAQSLATQSADDAMKSYAALAQLHAENMQKLSSAFSTLYASLSDDQKKIADALFRNERPRGPAHGAARRHKPAAAASAPAASGTN